MCLFQPLIRHKSLHGRGVPDIVQTLETLQGSKGAFRILEIEASLMLEEVIGAYRTTSQMQTVLMEEKDFVDIDDTQAHQHPVIPLLSVLSNQMRVVRLESFLTLHIFNLQ
jgi:hypothetical protein